MTEIIPPECPRCGDPCYDCTLDACALDEATTAAAEALYETYKDDEPEGAEWHAGTFMSGAQAAVDAARQVFAEQITLAIALDPDAGLERWLAETGIDLAATREEVRTGG